MRKLEVSGKRKLKGIIKVSGSKNASLPILAATILSNKSIKISNLPRVKDIETMISLLISLGSKIKILGSGNSIEIINSDKIKTFASYRLVKTMRAGILVLGPLLARFKRAKVSLPGGCAIGARPVDIHLKSLSKLGAKYKIKDGYIFATAPKGLKGNKITFPRISVGATENIIIAACFAKGKTILKNCAIEPEINDLILFLKKMGFNIEWKGKRTLKIIGCQKTKKTIHNVMSDRIEACTYLIAGALTAGRLYVKNINPKIITTEINILRKIGVNIRLKNSEALVMRKKKLRSLNLKTAPYPGFPTDLQAQIMVLLCTANGISSITETIFENRFMHAPELNRMGAKIKIKGNKAIITGNIKFKSAELMATDLRASVSLVLAALCAEGKSKINRIYHLERGYEGLEKKLRKVGSDIKKLS
ncbi:MAG: UDP-N-acetylglucosamine 1-carboxyvinyltransferase [Candidatus Pelagibacter sp. TMED275]|nr:MAG: UDP-N-acetylglucosamine 1-carboxyvinyltransferase [Candidatus Pelagibacter sp. TMED275]|tara:strand:+ start:2659 stop:3918 length:1260 start_codon:yes stop_codon:yes gene_type:complete